MTTRKNDFGQNHLLRTMILSPLILFSSHASEPAEFFESHCTSCHDAETHKGNLDLTGLKQDFANPENFARWVKVHDRIKSGEMPPKKKPRPAANDLKAVTAVLNDALAGTLDPMTRSSPSRATGN